MFIGENQCIIYDCFCVGENHDQPSNLGIPHVQTASHPQVPGPHVAASWKTPGKSLAEPRCPASIDVTRNLKARDEDGNDDDDDDEEGEREKDKHG